jgi:hypothetical protein
MKMCHSFKNAYASLSLVFVDNFHGNRFLSVFKSSDTKKANHPKANEQTILCVGFFCCF